MIRLILLSAAVLTLCSCYHVYYAPNTANAPLLTQKGETRINAVFSAGLVSEASGGELQTATALSSHVGLMVNGYVASKTEDVDEDFWSLGTINNHTEKGHGSYLEVAVGMFTYLNARKGWVGEVYGGYGVGTVTNDYGYNDHSKVNCSKAFVQPAIGFKAEHIEVAFVPKVSLIHWRIKDSVFTASSLSEDRSDLRAIGSKSSYIAFEPAFIIRGGSETVKGQLGLSFSTRPDLQYQSKDDVSLVETLNASIGVSFSLGGKKGK
jgi:hypothetical protein